MKMEGKNRDGGENGEIRENIEKKLHVLHLKW